MSNKAEAKLVVQQYNNIVEKFISTNKQKIAEFAPNSYNQYYEGLISAEELMKDIWLYSK